MSQTPVIVEATDILLGYYFNTPSHEMAQHLWADSGISNIDTWTERFNEGLVPAWNQMDSDTKQKFCDNANRWWAHFGE